MRVTCYAVIFLFASIGCARKPFLPKNSTFNVTGILNDSVWYGTGRVLRIKDVEQKLQETKQFNLLVATDIDYPGMSGGANPNTSNGCLDPECTKTQLLAIYNIPLRRGRTSIKKLNNRSTRRNEYANLSYVGNSGGVVKRYISQKQKTGWVRVTKVDKKSGIVEGHFLLSLQEDKEVYNRIHNGMPETMQFVNGLFRIKTTNVLLRQTN